MKNIQVYSRMNLYQKKYNLTDQFSNSKLLSDYHIREKKKKSASLRTRKLNSELYTLNPFILSIIQWQIRNRRRARKKIKLLKIQKFLKGLKKFISQSTNSEVFRKLLYMGWHHNLKTSKLLRYLQLKNTVFPTIWNFITGSEKKIKVGIKRWVSRMPLPSPTWLKVF